MKYLILIALLSVTTLHAQRNVEINKSLSKNQDVFLDFKFAQDIRVEHGNTNEVKVKASVNIDDGEGNEFFSIKTDNASGQLKLYSDFGAYFKNQWKDKSRNNCNLTTEINYVVTVPKNINLKIKSISGSVFMDAFQGDLVTDLISGDVIIKKYDGELRLKTISGALDVTVRKAELNAKSLTGTIYSDIEFEKNTSAKSYNGSHNRVSKQINGGTLSLEMETISGNIYIRKS
ncbi:DUF4097 family beta strand repeat-containing protein [Psychroserpens ponticola]|uniref:Adhesin domain-containing protein n=1 Tax=Psychroserpens ponticola TaxID=2932268 RepID=A0ABY7RZV2_9FLAO|nr:hypothetical protein [Psychroserpens ponticola]WCO01215.1 hypothetical protein MUN68_014235 [Psychroserpens ponticola]